MELIKHGGHSHRLLICAHAHTHTHTHTCMLTLITFPQSLAQSISGFITGAHVQLLCETAMKLKIDHTHTYTHFIILSGGLNLI